MFFFIFMIITGFAQEVKIIQTGDGVNKDCKIDGVLRTNKAIWQVNSCLYQHCDIGDVKETNYCIDEPSDMLNDAVVMDNTEEREISAMDRQFKI